MIEESDFLARWWDVVPSYRGGGAVPHALIEEMFAHPEAAGKSSDGTANILHAFVLSTRPKTVLEIGAHIGFGAVVIGSALKANGFGRSFHIEPQDHYFELLSGFIGKAGLEGIAIPLQKLSTDPDLAELVGSSVEMIYLDANHAYSQALGDLRIVVRLLAPKGLIFIDDVGAPHSADICPEGRGGVRQALLDFMRARPDYGVVFFEHPFWLILCGLVFVFLLLVFGVV